MTPTDALIEKMARAIHEAQDLSERGFAWDSLSEPEKQWNRQVARAAYEAEHEEDGK